jgi:hypothetical protein
MHTHTKHFSIMETIWSVLFLEVIAVFSENYMKPMNTLYTSWTESKAIDY